MEEEKGEYLAAPPGECCTKVSHHEGEPQGDIVQINNVNMYVARPAQNRKNGKGILYIVDAYGLYQNAKLLADRFALEGYLVCMPDILENDPLTDNVPIPEWVARHPIESVESHLNNALRYIHIAEQIEKVAAVGYCFGGKYVTRYLNGEAGRNYGIDAGFIAHPSFVLKSEFEEIKGPLAIAAAETDPIFTTSNRHEAEDILKNTGQPYQINLYSGTTHGFAVKGDLTVKAIHFAQDQAFWQAVRWFEYWI
ncbi:hypothetical protein ABW19_dt0205023 [Dactylella cylindrospora]|nr:hypothetical protein ABW19_dt0205023 [Dactylella cylindrospora]